LSVVPEGDIMTHTLRVHDPSEPYKREEATVFSPCLGSGLVQLVWSFPSLCSPRGVFVLVWVSVAFRNHLRGPFPPSVPHTGSPFWIFLGEYYGLKI